MAAPSVIHTTGPLVIAVVPSAPKKGGGLEPVALISITNAAVAIPVASKAKASRTNVMNFR
jgi:hypothetical protein